MRHTVVPTLALALALVSCAPKNGTSLDLLNNPLFAEYYYDDLVESMVNIELREAEEVNGNADLKQTLDDVRREGLAKAKEADQRQGLGTYGRFVQAKEYAHGEVLFLENTIYIGPEFQVTPGPALTLYMSKTVDPREVESFPGGDDIELGPLASPFGAQHIATPEVDPTAYRTLVIYDKRLKRLYGFAQLAK